MFKTSTGQGEGLSGIGLKPIESEAFAVDLDLEPARFFRNRRKVTLKRTPFSERTPSHPSDDRVHLEIPSIAKLDANDTDRHRLFERACESVEHGRYSLAIALLNRVLNRRPDHAEAWFKLGFSYGALRRHRTAADCYDKCLELEPGWSEAWTNRGFHRLHLRRKEEALSDARKALEISPSSSAGQYVLALVLIRLSDFEQAAAALKVATQLDPDNEFYHYRLADCLVHLRDRKGVMRELKRACEINPSYLRAWLQLILRLRRADEWPVRSETPNISPTSLEEAPSPNLGVVLRRDSYVVSEREAAVQARWQRTWDAIQNPVAWIAILVLAALLYILLGK